ncbi:hypothetical protein FN846DRAFT_1021235 [Sphaerosporella brunnea]|uniref:F-box domain-containing protein n=1 Tax=Sphaerosporella brunnea TaxID=1250544 RepID=A0A5J5EYJ4_9PEZI|nr:hypothetical protein FN846DRAFT_1021235 [Sphaerosporella brunnea]
MARHVVTTRMFICGHIMITRLFSKTASCCSIIFSHQDPMSVCLLGLPLELLLHIIRCLYDPDDYDGFAADIFSLRQTCGQLSLISKPFHYSAILSPNLKRVRAYLRQPGTDPRLSSCKEKFYLECDGIRLSLPDLLPRLPRLKKLVLHGPTFPYRNMWADGYLETLEEMECYLCPEGDTWCSCTSPYKLEGPLLLAPNLKRLCVANVRISLSIGPEQGIRTTWPNLTSLNIRGIISFGNRPHFFSRVPNLKQFTFEDIRERYRSLEYESTGLNHALSQVRNTLEALKVSLVRPWSEGIGPFRDFPCLVSLAIPCEWIFDSGAAPEAFLPSALQELELTCSEIHIPSIRVMFEAVRKSQNSLLPNLKVLTVVSPLDKPLCEVLKKELVPLCGKYETHPDHTGKKKYTFIISH